MQTATCGALGPRDVLLSCGLSGMAYAYCDRRPFCDCSTASRGVTRDARREKHGEEPRVDGVARGRWSRRDTRWSRRDTRTDKDTKTNAGASRASP
jgi:hypothetical protein